MLHYILPRPLIGKLAVWLYRNAYKSEAEAIAINLHLAGLIDHDEYLRILGADSPEEIIWVFQRLERIKSGEEN